MKIPGKKMTGCWWVGVFLGAWISIGGLCAATPVRTPAGRVTGGFQAPVFDEKGDLKTQFEGQGFRPLQDGRYLITQFTLKTFKGRNEVDLIAEARECFFKQTENLASSPGALKVRQSSGRFQLDGTGFEWRQSLGQLIVSNQVHAIIRDGGTNQTGSVASDFDVTSDRLEYVSKDTQTLAIFRGNVHAIQKDRIDLKCGVLSVRMGARNTGFEEILATGAVEVLVMEGEAKYEATGEKALFSPGTPPASTDRVVIEGGAGWRARGYEGSGDQLTLISSSGPKSPRVAQPNQVSFEVQGNAKLRVPPGALSDSAASTNKLKAMEIASRSYNYTGNQVLFTGDVRAVSEGEWALKSGMLEVLSAAATNRLDRIVATGAVKISLMGKGNEGEISGERAELEASGGVLKVTGSPEWKLQEFNGSGDSVRIFTRSKEPDIEVTGRSRLSLPGTGLASGGLIPTFHPQARTEPAALPQADPIRVESAGLRMSGREARFQGPVVVRNSAGEMSSQTLVAGLDATGKRLEKLLAEGDVRVRQAGDEVESQRLEAVFSSKTNQLERLTADGQVRFIAKQGERVTRGQGEKLVLDALHHEVVLEGHPGISLESGILLECDDRIHWDLVTRKIRAKNYRISGTGDALKAARTPGAK